MPVEIRFGKNAKKENVTNFSLQVLEDILQAAGLSGALISSTARTPAEQARVMFDNIVSAGVAGAKKIYPGDGGAEGLEDGEWEQGGAEHHHGKRQNVRELK